MKTMYKFKVTGVVQGVGFRPHIANVCAKAGLLGYVQNVGDGVVIVTNKKEVVEEILRNLPSKMRVDTVTCEVTDELCDGFYIKESTREVESSAEIPPDLFCCPNCEAELSDEANRRCGYFFITCTTCGPRFTISLESPFDRETTTMRDFPMCTACKAEYENASDRRFHAQTIACKECGPKLSLYENGKSILKGSDDEYLQTATEAIEGGETIAIKGVGGFHLACALEEQSITHLNELRERYGKPYAIMCKDMEMALSLATITKKEEEKLLSVARPIVLVKKRTPTPALDCASELDTIGIMLPYTPLHHLLFRHYNKPVVMTSSNKSNEPITTTEAEQFVPIVLNHDRRIQNPADDSVVKVIAEQSLLIRRSRGYVPRSIAVPNPRGKTILALGSEMNNTFALLDKNGRMTLSQHMGNTANVESFERYKKAIDDFLNYTHTTPDLIVRDLHPVYNTSQYGEVLAKRFNVPLVEVQHHRAHVEAVAMEHNLKDYVGIACDGLGYGEDGHIWGGEIFSNGVRIGHLEEQLQLGGDSATQFPHRMLYGILRNFLTDKETRVFMHDTFSTQQLAVLEKQLIKKFNSPLTSSCGRVLDATSALLGFCNERTYDGRPAMLLEAYSTLPYDLDPIIKENVLMTTPLFQFLVENMHRDKARLGATAQHYLAKGLYQIAKSEGKPIVFAGGCAYNRIMTTTMLEHGVLLNKEIPPGDGGISAGQISAVLRNS